ncbi:hypothetical protein BGZ83_001842 [Gryganskiella cystojenkinii]|nr:hypothetical protein BGZ83_001842 [Gryganskiella cystojenkinii]
MAPHQAYSLAAYDDSPASSSSVPASHPSDEGEPLSRQSIDSVGPNKSNDEDNEENEANVYKNSIPVGNPREEVAWDGEKDIPFSESVPRQQSFSTLLKVRAQTLGELFPLALGAATMSESGHGYVHGVINDESEGDDGISGNGILLETTCNSQSPISLTNASNCTLVASQPPDLQSTSDPSEGNFSRRWFFVTSEILDSNTQAASLIGDGILRTTSSMKTTDPGLDPPTDSGNSSSGAIVKLGLTQVESSPVTIHMPKHRSAQISNCKTYTNS